MRRHRERWRLNRSPPTTEGPAHAPGPLLHRALCAVSLPTHIVARMPPLDLRTQRAVTVSAALGRHRYDLDPSTAIAEARAAAGGDAEVLAEEAGRWADFYGAPAGRGARDGGLREALSRSRALRSNAEVRRMAGRTRDLAGAAFGDPWQARTRQGLPVKPPTWRIVASFADGERLVVERRGATDAEPFERIDALRKRPFGARRHPLDSARGLG